DGLGADAESRSLSAFSFSPEDHAARVAMLLWRDQRSAAQRLFPRLSPADRLLAQARIGLQVRQRRGLQEAVDSVPASRRDDPGFVYD
ncbi:hypothetical protein ACG92T_16550, partial [Acinetobacter ursingii]|uniref:hypothetical protein n=1 Tax=Acinetobacter ursingii TaxID=108980 RepID=UPI003AF8F9DB